MSVRRLDRSDLEIVTWRWGLNEPAEETMVSTDSLRVEITYREGDDELRLSYDEDLAVLDVTSRPTAAA